MVMVPVQKQYNNNIIIDDKNLAHIRGEVDNVPVRYEFQIPEKFMWLRLDYVTKMIQDDLQRMAVTIVGTIDDGIRHHRESNSPYLLCTMLPEDGSTATESRLETDADADADDDADDDLSTTSIACADFTGFL